MREYRGIDITTLQWIYGSLIVDEYGNHYIGRAVVPKPSEEMWLSAGRSNGKMLNRFIGFGFSMVIPESVGQDTGMTDKNDKKIFEGDIVHTKEFNLKGAKYNDHNYLVIFVGGAYILVNSHKQQELAPFARTNFCEVIGNGHEHPNLLDREGKD